MTLVLVVMGVAGAGKTTLGQALAARLGWLFQDGDDLHPAANVAKMRAGVPLDDADRMPWLDAVAAWIETRSAAGEDGVISCSALKRAYRDRLRRGRPPIRFVFLDGDYATLEPRMSRTGHFFPASLLASQFADLEPPTAEEAAIAVPVAVTTDAQVAAVLSGLASTP